MRKKNQRKIRNLSNVALGAALICVCSWISIPTPVPFTMQTFAVFFVLSTLGGGWGTASILLYVFLGALGLPVFSRFNAGVGVLFGSTGGYVLGFILMGLLYFILSRLFGEKPFLEVLYLLLGLFILYVFGTFWFYFVYLKGGEKAGLTAILSWCVFPFVVPDLIKLFLALLLKKRLLPIIRRS